MKMFCRSLLRFAILYLAIFITVPDTLFSFRDLDSEANEAAEGFSREGMFGSFIYQYGNNLFRPDGYVTRENLILILNEYHIITMKLLKQNKKILVEMDKLKTKKMNDQNMDLMLQEFQKVLEPMLRNSATIHALKTQIYESGGMAGGNTGTYSEYGYFDEIDDLNNKMNSLEKQFRNLSKDRKNRGYTGSSADIDKKFTVVADELKRIKGRVTGLKKDVYLQRKQISEISIEKKDYANEIGYIQDEVKMLNEKVENITKNYLVSSASSGQSQPSDKTANVKQVVNLTNEIEQIKSRIIGLKKDVFLQKEKVDKITSGRSNTDLNALQEDFKDLNRKIQDLSRLYKTSSETGKETEKMLKLYTESGKKVDDMSNDLHFVKDEITELKKVVKTQKKSISEINEEKIKNLELVIAKQEKYIEELYQTSKKEEAYKSSGGSMIPFWVKLSLGFSTFALFFLAR